MRSNIRVERQIWGEGVAGGGKLTQIRALTSGNPQSPGKHCPVGCNASHEGHSKFLAPSSWALIYLGERNLGVEV